MMNKYCQCEGIKLKVKFPFICKNLYLIAEVDEQTEERFLALELADITSKKTILKRRFYCPHTKIPELDLDEIDTIKIDDQLRNDFIEKSTNIVQYEGIRTLGLKPKGVLNSMKIWVQKFAEKGVKSLVEQNEISRITGFRMRFVSQIAEFVARMNPTLISEKLNENPKNIIAFLDIVGFSWVPNDIKHYFTHIYGAYVPKRPQYIQNIIQYFDDNLELLRDKDNYPFRKFIWYFKPEIIGHLIQIIVKNYQIQHLTLEETVAELVPFWKLFDEELSTSIDGITEDIVRNSYEFLPENIGSLLDIPPILPQLVFDEDPSYIFKILEFIIKDSNANTERKKNTFEYLVAILGNVDTFKLPSNLLGKILDIIPAEFFLEQQQESYYLFYLGFIGKHGFMSQYLQKVIQHYSNDYLITHFEQIYEILILQKYSPIFQNSYWAPNIQSAFYGNVSDIDCPIYLRDCKNLFLILLENLSLEKILEKFDFIELIIFSQGTEFIPLILEKILRYSSNTKRDILKEDPSVNKFLDEVQKNFCIEPKDIDRVQWSIPREIFDNTYKSLKFIDYHEYPDDYMTESGMFFLNEYRSIFQFMKVIDLYPDWKKKFSRIFLTEALFAEDLYLIYLNFAAVIPIKIQDDLLKLSKKLGKPVKIYKSLKSVNYDNWEEDECYFDEDDEPVYYHEYPSDVDEFFVIIKNNNIEQLYITTSKLEYVPDCIFDFCNLKVLVLSGNNLTEIPESVCKLRRLKFLNLSYNKLHNLPRCLGKLKNLEILLLQGNSINDLMGIIEGLQNLRVLNIISNNFSFLPSNIKHLGALRQLSLDNDLVTEKSSIILHLLKERGCSVELFSQNSRRWFK